MKNINPYLYDGKRYDAHYGGFTDDVPFYLSKIKKYGEPVLELACGTGRITIPIAEKGIEITGLDISDSMLAQARKNSNEKGADVEWVKADCRDFKLEKRFNLIFFPINSICHLLDIESIESCFRCVSRHLKSSGRFVISVFNPRLDILIRDPSKRYPVAKYPDPDGKGTVVITENNVYDKAAQINRIKWYFKIGKRKREIVENLDLRIFYPQELDALLKYNGFRIESKFGDYKGKPFTSKSPMQVIISSKRR